MFTKPQSNPDFFKLEEQTSDFWQKERIFEKSVENRKDSKDYIFYDGPPFMSGMPHYAHLLSSIMKDIIPRYQTMLGKKVERVWGWDCHGLPIENKVENELNLSGKKEIEAYGLDKFIEKCYEWNRVGIENWRWYIERIGRWVDIDNAYRTLDQDYMESIWWTFKQIWDKGLIYKGRRTSLYSTDFSTPVSDFEVSMDPDNYQDTEDIAVSVKFKLVEDSRKKLETQIGNSNPIYMVAWTTTPWTLPSNFALAVNPEAEYVIVDVDGENLILAKKRVEDTFNNLEKQYTQIAELAANDLVGLSYEQLYNFLPGGTNDFKVYASNYVTTEDGTGVLHVAPAFGEEDAKMGEEWNLSFTADIDDEGNMQVGDWKGMYLRKANALITEDLKNSGKLLKSESYMHRLPYYRGKNPLIYKTQEDYFINVQSIKDQLIKSNEGINWVPEHFKTGRFEYILKNAPDWSVSRSRSWGTAMPLWINEDGESIVIASRDELMFYVNSQENPQMQKIMLSLDENDKRTSETLINEVEKLIEKGEVVIEVSSSQKNLTDLRNKLLGETGRESEVKPVKANENRAYFLFEKKPLDLHRPYIDKVTFIKDGKEFKRISYTMDVWMDSGSMPYAQFHYPFQNKEKFEESFPGDYISEYTGQIRAWFYVLHVLSNAVFGKNAFKNVLVSGVLAGTDGRKMSKTYGNYPDPKDTIIKYSGDALRLYFANSTLMSGNDMNFSEYDLKMQVREFMLPLWNIYSFLVTYSQIHEWSPKDNLAYNSRVNEKDPSPWNHIPFSDVENELDAWILVLLQKTIKEVRAALDNYEIPRATRLIKELVDNLSKWYIRSNRDRFGDGDQSALETLYYVYIEILKLLAPFAPFVTEHIYRDLVAPHIADAPDSIHLCDYPESEEKFIDQYQSLEPEMDIIRKMCEMGQTLRTVNQLKVRQPLSKVEIKTTNPNVPALSQWMKDLIKKELNVKEVVEVIDAIETETKKKLEDTSIGVAMLLDTFIDPSLMEEGNVRELVRAIQATRKKLGLQQGEKVNIQFATSDSDLANIVEKYKEKISESVGAITIEKVDNLEDNNIQKVNGTDINLKIFK